MDEDSNVRETSNSSAKRLQLINQGAAGEEAEVDERKDIPSANDVEMSDEPAAPGPVSNSNDDDSKKDGGASATVEDSSFVENDNKEDQASEETEDQGTDRNEPGNPNKRYIYIGNSSSYSEVSDDNKDQVADHISISSSSSNSSSNSSSEDSQGVVVKNYSDECTIPDIHQFTHKPDYKWNQYRELMFREYGLSGKGRSSITGASQIAFQNRFYGSRHVIERMRLLHHLKGHNNCVNSLHFNKAGNFLVSGADDLMIILWNWSANKIAYAFNSGHVTRVFQTKFVELAGGINLVSSGWDGQIRYTSIPPSGSKRVISQVPVHMMCPQHLEDKKPFDFFITRAVYNNTGSEILASYSGEDIYLFNNKCYFTGHFSHQYKGHNYERNLKGFNFFGLNSEYVVSGSDCGEFDFWDKETESLINWIKGDTSIVNCLEPHPSFPVLASSGLDLDVKIWMPFKEDYAPPMERQDKRFIFNFPESVIRDALANRSYDIPFRFRYAFDDTVCS